MIQRIQTVFLLLAGATFLSLFKAPFAISDTATARFLADGVYDITDHPVLIGLVIGGALLAAVTIFLFKKRKVQLKLGYFIMTLAILIPLIAFLLFMNESATMASEARVQDQAGMFLPAGVIIFTALANYFIRKDERLVKSMDRLR